MLSTTSNQQQQQQRNSGGRRQPFGFLNSNTISTSTTAKGILDISGGSGTSNNSSSSTKKNMRGILKSLVTRGTTTMAKGNKKNELLAEKKKTNDFDVKEVSTEKKEEEEGEKMDATPSGNVDGIADSNNNVTTTNGSVFFASDNDGVSSSSIFRKEERDVSYGFWNGDDDNEELENMWEIKLANPIFDSIDEAADGVEQSALADMIPDDVSKSIEKILYDNDRVREDSKHGFKIHIDQ